jgi:hypothetical protein
MDLQQSNGPRSQMLQGVHENQAREDEPTLENQNNREGHNLRVR